LSLTVWCASGAVATAALLLAAPVWSSEFSTLSFIVVPALTAALIGVFRHYPSAVLGGLALGVIQGMLAQTDAFSDYRSVVPFAALAVILLWRERKAVWDEVR
jgi:branched-chain amino acid transport system permease protein